MSKTLFDLVIPPKDDSAENIRRWRIVLGIAVLLLLMHASMAMGWYQKLGISGFAYASTVKEIKIGLLEKDLFDTIKSHCLAPTQESKDFYAKQKHKLMSRYEETVGRPFNPVPTCKDLGVREVDPQ